MACREVKNIQFRKALEKEDLSLIHLMQDNGYLWIYSDNEKENFIDSAIYVNNFKDMSIEEWIEEIKDKVSQLSENCIIKNELLEKHGAIDEKELDCDRISFAIIDKIKSIIKDFTEETESNNFIIKSDDFKSNYGEDVFPFWINDFELEFNYYLQAGIKHNEGAVFLGKIRYMLNNKLSNCIMQISADYYDICDNTSKNYYFNFLLKTTIVHEFRHLHQKYIEKLYNFTNKDKWCTYKMAQDEKLNSTEPFKDMQTIVSNIKKTFYYIDKDEINSYILQYAKTIQNHFEQFNYTYAEMISNYIKSGKFPYDNMHVSYYDTYLFLHSFWKDIENKVNEETLKEVVWHCENLILLNSKLKIFLFHTNAEYIKAFLEIRKNVISILENVLHKMACIYYDEVQKHYEELKSKLDAEKKEKMLLQIKEANKIKNYWFNLLKTSIEKAFEKLKKIFTKNNMNENKNWTDDISTKWEPREGLFLEKNPVTIVNYLMKHSKDYAQAMRRLNFYMNRAGDDLKNKTVLNKAKALLKKRGEKLKESNSFEDAINSVIAEGIKQALNEFKWEFDPRTGSMEPVMRKSEDEIHLMSQFPAKSCMIKLLQNRINLNSVGNQRYAKTLWFDLPSKKLYSDKTMQEEFEFFRTYDLPGCGKPAGWIYVN